MKIHKLYGSVLGIGVLWIGSVMLFGNHEQPPLDAASVEPSAVQGQTTSIDAPPRLEIDVEPASTGSAKISLRDFLRDWYGAGWESKVSKLPQDVLSRQVDPSKLLAWEDAAEDLRVKSLIGPENLQTHADASIGWRANRYDSWANVREEFSCVRDGLTDQQLAAFREYAKPFDDSMRGLAAQHTAVLADVQSLKWAAGEFVRSPFVSAPLQLDSGRQCVHLTNGSSTSLWTMTMALYEDELPPVAFDLNKLLGDARLEREQKLTAYLQSL